MAISSAPADSSSDALAKLRIQRSEPPANDSRLMRWLKRLFVATVLLGVVAGGVAVAISKGWIAVGRNWLTVPEMIQSRPEVRQDR